MEFASDVVWGLAVRADTYNQGYVKEAVYDPESNQTKLIKQPNKVLVKQWLRDGVQPTAQEIEQGQIYRNFFKTYTLKLLSGNINDFDKQALRISQKDNFTGRDLLEFSIISCLPATVRREQENNSVKKEMFYSTKLDAVPGQYITAECTVAKCTFSSVYNKFKILARIEDSFIEFWFSKKIDAKSQLRIKAKVRDQLENNTTRLHYVKLLAH